MQSGSVALPGRPLDQQVQIRTNSFLPPVGGAHGPAALPSEIDSDFGAAPPAVAGGAYGPIARFGFEQTRRGPNVENAGAPRTDVDNTLGHQFIPWSRPRYANAAGLRRFRAATELMSWTANQIASFAGPRSGIPVSIKRIDNFTLRQEYGSDRQFFPGPAEQVDDILQNPTAATKRRWMKQAKTVSPYQPRLTIWSAANSYGQSTSVLNTGARSTSLPGNPYIGPSAYGAY